MTASAGSAARASGLADAGALSDGAVLPDAASLGAVEAGAVDALGVVEPEQAPTPSSVASPRASSLREFTGVLSFLVSRSWSLHVLRDRRCPGHGPGPLVARRSPPPVRDAAG